MIEFAAGITVGALLGLVAGLLIASLLQRPPVAVQAAPVAQPAPPAPQLPQPQTYQPPVIVLAGIQRPQQTTTALQTRA